MRMNTARFEIFADDLDTSPYISRSIPAALDGLIDNKAFQDFANELDVLLKLLDTDHQRFRNRYWLVMYGYVPVYFGIFVLSLYYPMIGTIFLWVGIIYMASVWLFITYCVKGPKTVEEILREIRSICEDMSNRTPNVSFHPIIKQVPVGGRMMETILNIDVSISDNAFAAIAAVAADAAVISIDENHKLDIH